MNCLFAHVWLHVICKLPRTKSNIMCKSPPDNSEPPSSRQYCLGHTNNWIGKPKIQATSTAKKLLSRMKYTDRWSKETPLWSGVKEFGKSRGTQCNAQKAFFRLCTGYVRWCSIYCTYPGRTQGFYWLQIWELDWSCHGKKLPGFGVLEAPEVRKETIQVKVYDISITLFALAVISSPCLHVPTWMCNTLSSIPIIFAHCLLGSCHRHTTFACVSTMSSIMLELNF